MPPGPRIDHCVQQGHPQEAVMIDPCALGSRNVHMAKACGVAWEESGMSSDSLQDARMPEP